MRLIDLDSYRKQLIDQIQLGGSEGCLFGLEKAVDMLDQRRTILLPGNEPLTQADLDKMDFDKVWISYGPEPDNGEEALVYNRLLYSIDNLEGAGFEDMLNDLINGEALDNPTGVYKVYRSLSSPVHVDQEMWKPCKCCFSCENCLNAGTNFDHYPCAECISTRARVRFRAVGFCRSCGRPLTPEAWTELKNRLRVDNV